MVEIGLPETIGLLFAGGVSVYFAVKYRLHKLRILFDSLDDALYDDKVTEDEFRKVYEDVKALLTK